MTIVFICTDQERVLVCLSISKWFILNQQLTAIFHRLAGKKMPCQILKFLLIQAYYSMLKGKNLNERFTLHWVCSHHRMINSISLSTDQYRRWYRLSNSSLSSQYDMRTFDQKFSCGFSIYATVSLRLLYWSTLPAIIRSEAAYRKKPELFVFEQASASRLVNFGFATMYLSVLLAVCRTETTKKKKKKKLTKSNPLKGRWVILIIIFYVDSCLGSRRNVVTTSFNNNYIRSIFFFDDNNIVV